MSPFGQQFWATVAGGSLLLPLVIVVVYLLITHWFSADLERHKTKLALAKETELAATQSALRMDAERILQSHKATLDSDNAKSIEQLKAQLQIASTEHEIRFSRLHEKQAETIAAVYASIIDLQAAVGDYVAILETSDMPSKAERREKVNEALKRFRVAFFPNRLYFSRTLAESITDLNKQLRRIAQEFAIGVEGGRDERWAATGKEYVDTWSKTSIAMEKDIPPLIAKLESEFRKQLGIADD